MPRRDEDGSDARASWRRVGEAQFSGQGSVEREQAGFGRGVRGEVRGAQLAEHGGDGDDVTSEAGGGGVREHGGEKGVESVEVRGQVDGELVRVACWGEVGGCEGQRRRGEGRGGVVDEDRCRTELCGIRGLTLAYVCSGER